MLEKFEWKTTKNLQVVVDPTMLLNVDYYKCLISNIGITITDKKVISTYILDKDKIADDIIYKISRCLGLHCVDIIDSKHWKEKDYIMPSIEEWLARIANSTFVITDSFHGTVFSIIFNTPFIVKVNRTRGRDRFETLLGYFDLQYRMVDDDKTALEIVEEKIEWSEVNAKLKDLRNRGCKFLYETLSK